MEIGSIDEEAPILVPGKKGRRFLAELADFFLMLVLEMLVYTLVALAINATPIGKTAGEQISLLQEESRKSGLRIQDEEGGDYNDEKLAEIYVDRVSYYNGENEPTDALYRYYCLYDNEKKPCYSASRYNHEILRVGEEDSLFVDAGEGKVAVLPSEFRAYVRAYVGGERNDADAINAVRSLKAFYEKAYETAWAEFATSSPYSDYLKSYTNAATKHYLTLGLGAIGSYIIAGGVFYFLIPSIHKTGKGIGKRVLHLEALGRDGEPLKWSQIFLRGSIGFAIGTFAIPFATFFVYGFDGFMLPFALFGKTALRLSLFLAFGGLFGVASTCFMLFRKDGASLAEIVSNTAVYTTDVALIGAERAKREAEREKARG